MEPFTQEQLDAIAASVAASAGPMIDERLTTALAPLAEAQESRMATLLASVSAGPRQLAPAEKGIALGRYCRAIGAGRGHRSDVIAYAEQWDDDLGKSIVKQLSSGDATAGGFLLPTELADEVIELLRAVSAVRRAGAISFPMPTGQLTIPRLTGGSTASYEGENATTQATEPTFGQIVLTWKKLKAIVPMSNELLMFSAGIGADRIVRDDLIAALATREDQAFIRDDGTQNTPKGMRFWAQSANIIVANGTINLANIRTDLRKIIQALKGANVRMLRPVWFMSSRTSSFLMWDIADSEGRPVFREEMAAGMLNGWPWFETNNIPDNLGGGTDESELYFVDMADAIIGESTQLELAASSEASYVDSGGTLISAFNNDQTVIRAIERHDFAMRHEASIAVLTEVKWGS